MVKKTEKPAKDISKPAKPASKKAHKVFDVSKPGKGAPASATARPIIATHRPMLPDPMVSPADTSMIDEASKPMVLSTPSAAKVVIKPLSDTDETETPQPDAIELNIPDFGLRDTPKQVDADADGTVDVRTAKTAPNVAEKPEVKSEQAPAAKTEEPAAVATPAPEADSAIEDTAPKEEDSQTAPDANATTPEAAALPTNGPAPDTTDESAASDKTKEEQETATMEAEVKRQEELDKLVESKEYFLPITTAEHRRTKLVTIFGIILIILLGLLLVNMLMDLGTVRIKGVEPVTHFFSS